MIHVFAFSAEWLAMGMMIGEILRRLDGWPVPVLAHA